ncbi:MAG: tetratricopeptide repeat protein [Pseudomonadota bacterium]
MFDIIRSIKRIAGSNNQNDKNQSEKQAVGATSEVENSAHKIDKLSGFFGKIFDNIVAEFHIIKEKSQDLSTTNYNLGIQHLEDGDLKEAIFRFKITKKFWPNNYDAYYQLIICLILNHDFDEAQIVIEDLLEKCPAYQEKIDQILGNEKPNNSA